MDKEIITATEIGPQMVQMGPFCKSSSA